MVMKKVFALFAMICVLAAAGCNNGNKDNTSDTTTAAPDTTQAADADSGEGHKVTAIAYEEEAREDTTVEALEYLSQVAPLYKAYLEKRRTVPLTLETTLVNESGTWKNGIYIKDEKNFAQYSIDPSGVKTTVIYKDGFAYQIDDEKRLIYTLELGDERFASTFDSFSLRIIYYDDVFGVDYLNDTQEYKGTEYDHVNIAVSEDDVTDHYFDKATGDLVYTVSAGNESHIDKLENAVADDSVFELPADYEKKTFEDLMAELQTQAQTQQSENAGE